VGRGECFNDSGRGGLVLLSTPNPAGRWLRIWSSNGVEMKGSDLGCRERALCSRSGFRDQDERLSGNGGSRLWRGEAADADDSEKQSVSQTVSEDPQSRLKKGAKLSSIAGPK
jgi:hypothetical protein